MVAAVRFSPHLHGLMTDTPPAPPQVTRREPAINAPWSVVALIGLLIVAHLARIVTGGAVDRFALTSADLTAGRLAGLVTYQFVHGGWTHVLMNAAFVLAFGAPVGRFLGGSARGGAAFFIFFLACGIGAAAAYAGLAGLLGGLGRAGDQWALVGASGSASGLMGAAARLMEGKGRLGAMTGRIVTGMALGWIAMNALLGLSGLTPGAAGVPVAWEAHIFGFFCGLILIGPAARVAGVGGDHALAR